MWDDDSGEAIHVCGARGYMGTLYFLLNFAVKLKLLLKIKSIKRVYIFVCITDSLCHTPETNTTL